MKNSDENHKGQDFYPSAKSVTENDASDNTTTRDMKQRTPPPPSRTLGEPQPESDFRIEEAIALMRTLPAENVDLVVRVVKQTLESTNVDIPAVIADATKKEERIRKTISTLRFEIAGLEKEVSDRKREILALEADSDETAQVKERLVLAASLSKSNQGAVPTPRLA